MSKRVDSRSFGLWHRGHSLGEVGLCFRFLTTSRKFRRAPMGWFVLLEYAWLCMGYWTSMFSLG